MTGELSALRPTQFAVGIREVSEKRKKLEARGADAAPERRLSVILGPGRQLYLHDGHHYAVALHRMGIVRARMAIVSDLSSLDASAFWLALSRRGWARPIDGMGVPRPLEQMPATILALQDDPFRSLAGALRRIGRYVKTDLPYADFVWADFLRRRIAGACVDSDFEAALDDAARLTAGKNARHLPGWQGACANAIAASPAALAVLE